MKTVCLVDGSTSFLRYLELIVGRLGYKTVTAADTTSGLETARQTVPDMVMCESRLPDGDGLAFCRSIKEDPATGDAHVVIVSTDNSDETRRAAFESGCTEYLTKPVITRAVFGVLEKHIGNQRREKIRTEFALGVDVRSGDGRTQRLESANVGEGGLFLKTRHPAAVGSILDLSFALPGYRDALGVRGEVVYAFGERAEGFIAGMGIKFVDLDEFSQHRLSTFVEHFVTGSVNGRT